ncbi:OmpA family protein [Belliella kenyensis]|uniref:OmpA family protein n=1 Tax=Belliella kenyensis TaxID=1472724 RepID=A0ABV8EM80_9BACT|nr:OmpA family protein [Belliella kenyensis]MCH7400595.1 OmpA family protein [Belliella kenyensis]MDN3602118.1 OmpA family protein [Belliella kenyensis]
MKKLMIIFCLSLFTLSVLNAQQKAYDWRIGVSGGYSNYYGDLTPHRIRGISNLDAIQHLLYFNENYFDQYSWKVSLERQLSPTIGLQFSYGQYQFAMSDRYRMRNGQLMTDARNFDRALNFQTDARDMGIAFVFKTDNDRLLPAKSWIAPYATLGFGLIDYTVKGDLLDDNGNPYNYLDPTVSPNGIYETELSPLRTELENGYDLGVFYANLGLGIRFRLGHRVELFAQTDLIHSFTGYLDDVSGTYRETYDNAFQAYAAQPGTNIIDPNTRNRGENNGQNDWIIYHGVGLKYNFGARKSSFRAPKLSTHYPDYNEPVGSKPTKIEAPKKIDEEILTLDSIPSKPFGGNIYNYFNNFQITDQEKLDSLQFQTQALSWNQQIEGKKRQILEGKVKEKSLVDIQQRVADQELALKADTLLRATSKDSLLKATEAKRFDLRYSLDSIKRREAELLIQVDSLNNLIKNQQLRKGRAVFLDRSIFGFDVNKSNLDSTFGREEPKILSDTTGLYDKKNAPVSRNNISNENSIKPLSDLPSESLSNNSASKQTKEVAPNSKENLIATNLANQQLNDNRVAQQEQRIRQLEDQTRSLQRQKDSLNALPREVIYLGSNNTNTSQASTNERPSMINQSFRDTNRPQETVIYQQQPAATSNNNVAVQEERERRGLWRSIAAFFGGAAASRALDSRSQNTNNNFPMVSREVVSGPVQEYRNNQANQTELQKEQLERSKRVAQSVGFVMLGISPDMLAQQERANTQEKVEQPTDEKLINERPQPKADTVFIERDPEIEIKLLRFKETIFFQINQRSPNIEEVRKLADLADFIKENEGHILILTGFADNTGNVAYNLKLAEDRTNSVAEILSEQFGIPKSKIITESGGQVIRGSQRSSNDQDRRVEVRVEKNN